MGANDTAGDRGINEGGRGGTDGLANGQGGGDVDGGAVDEELLGAGGGGGEDGVKDAADVGRLGEHSDDGILFGVVSRGVGGWVVGMGLVWEIGSAMSEDWL